MRYPLMLQAFIVVVHIVPEARLHRPRGVYTVQGHGIHSHEIAIPRKVSERGVLISHNVTHHHHEDGPVVHYRLSVAGNEYHIELAAVEKFIGPGLVVERRKRDVHVRTRPKNSSSKCHYRGFIRGHPNSQVALSACDGLAGMLRGDHGEFWLEPVALSPEEERVRLEEERLEDAGAEGRGAAGLYRNSVLGRPHLVFRRSVEQPQLEIGAAGRARRRRKKKKKLERNCGTREPRRLTETRLEWQTQPGLVQVQGRGRRKQHHQTRRWQRSKRSISRPRHVEALVVADTTMMAFHQDGDVETYLLTIMNMVSSLYLDPTIGNFINVVVVRIILVEEDDAEVRANHTNDDVRCVQQPGGARRCNDDPIVLSGLIN